MKRYLKFFTLFALVIPIVILSGFSHGNYNTNNFEPPCYQVRKRNESADKLPLKITPIGFTVSMQHCVVFYDFRIHNPRKTAVKITSNDFTFNVDGKNTNNHLGEFYVPMTERITDHLGITEVCKKALAKRKSSIKIPAGRTIEFTIKQWVDYGSDNNIKVYFGDTQLV